MFLAITTWSHWLLLAGVAITQTQHAHLFQICPSRTAHLLFSINSCKYCFNYILWNRCPKFSSTLYLGSISMMTELICHACGFHLSPLLLQLRNDIRWPSTSFCHRSYTSARNQLCWSPHGNTPGSYSKASSELRPLVFCSHSVQWSPTARPVIEQQGWKAPAEITEPKPWARTGAAQDLSQRYTTTYLLNTELQHSQHV